MPTPGSPNTVARCGAAVAQRAFVGVSQQLELLLAAHEACPPAALPGVRGRERPPRPDLLAGPDLDRTRSSTSTDSSVRRRAPGPSAIVPGPRRLLQPGGDVDRFSGREGRVDVFDDELAGLDPDARLEPEIATASSTANAARTARSASSSWEGYAECGHHGVARELLDGAAVQLDLLCGVVEVAGHAPAHDFRVVRAEQRRRVDQIDEDHRCELPFHRSILGSGMG